MFSMKGFYFILEILGKVTAIEFFFNKYYKSKLKFSTKIIYRNVYKK